MQITKLWNETRQIEINSYAKLWNTKCSVHLINFVTKSKRYFLSLRGQVPLISWLVSERETQKQYNDTVHMVIFLWQR